jgi:hypothetical protein
MQKLAAQCGGSVALPRLRWKYAWMEPLLGWSLAKRAQYFLPELKASLVSSWDKAMYDLENFDCHVPSNKIAGRWMSNRNLQTPSLK